MNSDIQAQMARTFVVVLTPIFLGFVLWAVVKGWRWFRRKGF
jgi:hypothetical protein